MTSNILFDCTSSQQKRPEAIQFLMNFRQRVERDDSQFTIEFNRNDDGSSELVVKVSQLRTGQTVSDAAGPPEQASEPASEVADETTKEETGGETEPSLPPTEDDSELIDPRPGRRRSRKNA